MRLLVDENIAEAVVTRLRTAGHDVSRIQESRPGSSDLDVLEWAANERRTLISLDKDFGALVHRHRQAAPYGVVLFRLHPTLAPEAAHTFIAQSVAIYEQWPPGVWTIQIRHSAS